MRAKSLEAVAVIAIASVAGGTGSYLFSQHEKSNIAIAMTGGDPSRAPRLIRRYGCSGCHTIPGIPGGDGQVGGPLGGIKQRVFVGGVLANSPDAMVSWIVSPQTYSPRTAMPVTGVTEAEARDIAAYLYAQ